MPHSGQKLQRCTSKAFAPSAGMGLKAKKRLLSMIVKRSEKCEVTSSNSIASVRGVAHLRPTTFGMSARRSTMPNEMPVEVQKVL